MAHEHLLQVLSWLESRHSSLPPLGLRSPQLHRRRELVVWCGSVAEELGLRTLTLHLAVRLLDMFMDGHNIQEPQLYLTSLSCILVAAKVHENDSNIPRLSKLSAHLPSSLDASDLASMEFLLLRYLRCTVCLPTACEVLELLLPLAVLPHDLCTSTPACPTSPNAPSPTSPNTPSPNCISPTTFSSPSTTSSSPSTSSASSTTCTPTCTSSCTPTCTSCTPSLPAWRAARDELVVAARIALDAALQEEQLLQSSPHLVASGCLLAARLAAGLEGWPPRLAALTGLGRAELREVAALVGLVGQGGEDEGYVSIHASPTAAVL